MHKALVAVFRKLLFTRCASLNGHLLNYYEGVVDRSPIFMRSIIQMVLHFCLKVQFLLVPQAPGATDVRSSS